MENDWCILEHKHTNKRKGIAKISSQLPGRHDKKATDFAFYIIKKGK